MISIEDCIALCGLDGDQVLAISEHEHEHVHVPGIAAAALADNLLHQKYGAEKIRNMIVDDITAAFKRKDKVHAPELFMALRHFLRDHPEVNTPKNLPEC